ncbi:MAG TPA: Ig-like domain-containing protein, partial [Longimicrobiaceae bacterium]
MRCITRFAIPALLGLALSLAGAGVRPAAAQAEGGTVLRGDVNGDGSISALDGLAVLSHVVGKSLPQGFRVLPFGDADGNGEVTALDALVILAYIVGKDVSQFPIGKPVVATGAVTISPDHLKLRVDETVRLTAKVAGNDTAAVIWRSAKPGVASITAAGDVTGHVPGTVDIVAMAAADTTKRASISIEVKGESVSVTPDSATLVIGQTRQFTAVVNNPAGNPIPSRKVIWAVSDTSVIRVSSTGLVTAVGIGFASVTAIDEKDSKVTGGAVINVVAKAATPRQYLVSTDTPDPAPGATITIRAQLADSLGAAVKTAGRTVTWSKTLPAGSFATPTSTTDTAGVATVAYTVSTTAGAVDSVTATDNAGLKGTSGPIRVQIGAATAIRIIAGDSQSVKVNTAVPIPPKVQVVDASGNGVPNVVVTFAPTPGSGSVTGGTQTTSASGEATVGSWTLGTTPGLDSLTVSAAGLTVTITATALPGDPTDIALQDGDNQTGEVGTQLGQPLRVLVTDSLGNGVPGETVNWVVTSGGGSVSAPTSTTNGSGIASITWTLGTTAGAQTAEARHDSLNGSPVQFTATATPAGASRLSITTQPSDSVQSGAAFPRQPVIQLQDQYGNAVSQSGVTVTAGIASGAGALGGTLTAVSNASGVATFTDLTITGTIGDRTLSFSATGLTGATSDTVSVTAGAASRLAVTTQPSDSVQSGVAFPRQPTVQVQDA